MEMRKSGKSYNEILTKLRVPKSTLSDWFSHADWSREIKNKLNASLIEKSTARFRDLNKVRGIHLSRAYAEARKEAADEFRRLKYHPLFIAGLMLYWGEGDKLTASQTRIINTDADMINLFVLFLRNICQIPVEKIRGCAIIYPDLEATTCREYWSNRSGLPAGNFNKCVVIQGRHKTKRLSYGMGQILVSSTYFKAKMNEWLKLLPKELMNREYYAIIAPTNAGIV